MPARVRRAGVRRERKRLAVDVACEGVRAGVGRAELGELAEYVLRAERVTDAMLSVALVTPRMIARLNKQHLDHRGPTDVISFGLRGRGGEGASRGAAVVVGDIYVCPAVARTHAQDLGISSREEVRRLVVHGTLHVLGWTHPDTEDRASSPMWARQEQLLRRWSRRTVR